MAFVSPTSYIQSVVYTQCLFAACRSSLSSLSPHLLLILPRHFFWRSDHANKRWIIMHRWLTEIPGGALWTEHSANRENKPSAPSRAALNNVGLSSWRSGMSCVYQSQRSAIITLLTLFLSFSINLFISLPIYQSFSLPRHVTPSLSLCSLYRSK